MGVRKFRIPGVVLEEMSPSKLQDLLDVVEAYLDVQARKTG
jgi:Mor family transcriptional regulator